MATKRNYAQAAKYEDTPEQVKHREERNKLRRKLLKKAKFTRVTRKMQPIRKHQTKVAHLKMVILYRIEAVTAHSIEIQKVTYLVKLVLRKELRKRNKSLFVQSHRIGYECLADSGSDSSQGKPYQLVIGLCSLDCSPIIRCNLRATFQPNELTGTGKDQINNKA